MLAGLKMARRAEAQRAKVGVRGRICTCTGDALNVVSLLLDYASRELDPPAGVAPAESLYKSDPQAAAWRKKWSQSPVPPRKRQAYETRVSTGSTAVMTQIVLGSI